MALSHWSLRDEYDDEPLVAFGRKARLTSRETPLTEKEEKKDHEWGDWRSQAGFPRTPVMHAIDFMTPLQRARKAAVACLEHTPDSVITYVRMYVRT